MKRSGGCLAAILSMRIAQDDTIPVTAQPKLQVLICPVIDNTATISTTWAETKFSPWLTPARMTWYRQKYFTSSTEPREWTASPCFAHPQMLSRSPRTFIAVADCDLLATEGLDYAQKLRASGVDVEVKICPGATHSVLGLAGYVTNLLALLFGFRPLRSSLRREPVADFGSFPRVPPQHSQGWERPHPQHL